MAKTCSHFDQIRPVAPSTKGCEECLRTGDEWTELRVCLTCGHVGCCDDSKNRHATRHFEQTKHPLIRSLEPGEKWGWCYVHKTYFDTLPRLARGGLWTRLAARFGRANY